jgi:hypothetical protein
MRAAGVLVALSITSALSTPAAAGNNAIGVPPAKVDFGYLTFHAGDQLYGGGQWLIGLNWATVYPTSAWVTSARCSRTRSPSATRS